MDKNNSNHICIWTIEKVMKPGYGPKYSSFNMCFFMRKL